MNTSYELYSTNFKKHFTLTTDTKNNPSVAYLTNDVDEENEEEEPTQFSYIEDTLSVTNATVCTHKSWNSLSMFQIKTLRSNFGNKRANQQGSSPESSACSLLLREPNKYACDMPTQHANEAFSFGQQYLTSWLHKNGSLKTKKANIYQQSNSENFSALTLTQNTFSNTSSSSWSKSAGSKSTITHAKCVANSSSAASEVSSATSLVKKYAKRFEEKIKTSLVSTSNLFSHSVNRKNSFLGVANHLRLNFLAKEPRKNGTFFGKMRIAFIYLESHGPQIQFFFLN